MVNTPAFLYRLLEETTTTRSYASARNYAQINRDLDVSQAAVAAAVTSP